MAEKREYVVIAILDNQIYNVFQPRCFSEKQAVGYVKQLIKQSEFAIVRDQFYFAVAPKGHFDIDLIIKMSKEGVGS